MAGPSGAWNVARVTYGAVARMPVYYVLLLLTAFLILASPALALFEFAQEMRSVREMGFASIALWAFLTCLLAGPALVRQELEDRVGLLLFTKPFSRTSYLAGKFLGLGAAVAAGTVFLALVVVLTLWLASGLPALHGPAMEEWLYPTVAPGEAAPDPAARSVWSFVRDGFLARDAAFAAGAGGLCLMEGLVLAAAAVALSAVMPTLTASASLTLLYLLGHMLDYLVGALGTGGARGAAGEVLSTVLPNFGYLTLPGRFGAGARISWEYLCTALGYSLLYVLFLLGGAAAAFHRREIR